MANSGYCSTSYYSNSNLTFYWEATKEIGNNRSKINWRLVGNRSSGYIIGRLFFIQVLYTNPNTGAAEYVDIYYNDTIRPEIRKDTLIASNSFYIPHQQNGRQSFNVVVKAGLAVSAYNVEGSGSWELDDIPRHANFTEHYVSDTTLNSITVKWNADAGCDYIQYSLNGGAWTDTSGLHYTISNLSPGTQYSIKTRIRRTDSQLWTESSVIYGTTKKMAIVTGANNFNSNENPYMTFSNESGSVINARLEVGGVSIQRNGISNTGSYSFVLTEAERNLLYSKCSNSNYLTVRYVIATVVGGVETYWHFIDRTMTVTNSNPTFSNFIYKDVGASSTKLTGNSQIIINGYNVVQVIIPIDNKAIAKNGATIVKYRAVCESKSNEMEYSESTNVILELRDITNRNITVYAIDSRGNSTEVTKSISTENWKDYKNIIIKTASVSRINGVGSETKLKLEGEIWNNSFGTKNNEITECTYKYKKTSEKNYPEETLNFTTNITNNKFSADVLIKGDLDTNGFDVQNTYNIMITVKDNISISTFDLILGTGIPAIAIHKNGVSFGGPYNEKTGGTVQINGTPILDYEIIDEW